jgi:hypothetical protein
VTTAAVWGAFLSGLSSASAIPISMLDLLADGDQRVAEAVELGLRLALGRLDHHRAGTGHDIVGAWKP